MKVESKRKVIEVDHIDKYNYKEYIDMTSVKKLFIAIMAVVVGTHADVLTYRESFDDVKVISPAKSTYKTTCKTRVDLSEGLVDNSKGCDIEKILVYNKDTMWIGSLDGVEAGYHKIYADYDIDRYKGKGTQIEIVYSFTPQDADPSNGWMVSCPKGMIAYIYGFGFYSCRTMTLIEEIETEAKYSGISPQEVIDYWASVGDLTADEEKQAREYYAKQSADDSLNVKPYEPPAESTSTNEELEDIKAKARKEAELIENPSDNETFCNGICR